MKILKENNSTVMTISIFSGISSDGFEITIIKNDKVVFQEKYAYGYNASWSRSFVTDSEPYVTDLIQELLVKYNINPSDIRLNSGRNVFKDSDVDSEVVTEFKNEYLRDIINV